jgi:uncharacterized protein (TIGR02599 family)
MSKPFSITRGRAFTILELLTAMAIFTFMVVALVGITGQAGNIWKNGEGQNQRRANGRALLQNIARELQQAALPVSLPARQGASSGQANLQFIANVSDNPSNNTEIPAGLLNPHAVFWQAPIARDASAGDLACIGYFVKWDTSGTRPKAQLCRYFVDPSDTANYLVYELNGNAAVDWLSNISTVAPSTADDLQGWFADNIIAFWVRCLDEYGQPITRTADGTILHNGYGFDSRQGYTDSTGRVHPAPALPAAVDLAMVTLDQQTAARLNTPIQADVGPSADFQQDIADFVNGLPDEIRKGAQVFSTRVNLQNYRP